MEKLKVGRKLFEKFNVFFEHADIDSNGIEVYIKKYIDKKHFFNEYYDELNKITLQEFLQAVYCGYELQESNEEILLKKYKDLIKPGNSLFNIRKAEGIFEALETLNIYIDEINK